VTGISIGDIIKVGTATPYWTRVTNITGAGPYTLVCSDAAGSSESGITISRYRQVTVADNWTSPGTTWAIGGKRRDLSNTATQRLFLDLKPGWTVDILQTGSDYNKGTTAITVVGGDTTGPVTIKSSSGTRPIILVDNSTNSSFGQSAAVNYIIWENLHFKRTGASRGRAISISNGGSVGVRVRNCTVEGATAGVYIGIGSCEVSVTGCTGIDCTGALVQIASGQTATTLYVAGNLMRSTQGSPSYYGLDLGTRDVVLRCLRNVFYNLAYGIYWATAGGYSQSWTVEQNTFHTIDTDAIRNAANIGFVRCGFRNNTFWNVTGVAININNGGATSVNDCTVYLNDYNAFGSCGTNVVGISASAGAITITGDPCVNAAGLDFRPDKTASEGLLLRSAGGPTSIGGQPNYPDVGAYQHSEPVLPAVSDVKTGVQYGAGGDELTGTYSGGGGGVRVHTGMEGGLNA
jgi:hypothetical protein